MLQASRIHNVSDPSFGEAWRLYEASFPLEEQRPVAFQKLAMEREPGFVCLRLHDEAGLAGLLFYWLLPLGMVYVEHLAVALGRRGQGIGSKALGMVEALKKPVILEIEPVVDEMTLRRFRFYESSGYVKLPYPHAQLPFRRGGSPVPMELLSLHAPMGKDDVQAFQEYLQCCIMQYRER